jgi:hypothetical protein
MELVVRDYLVENDERHNEMSLNLSSPYALLFFPICSLFKIEKKNTLLQVEGISTPFGFMFSLD